MTKGVLNELDLPETTIRHGEIIKAKPFLKKIYLDWYGSFKNRSVSLPDGVLLEIGSGGGFLKEVVPNVYTSDILPLPTCDGCFSAEQMPFENESVSAIFMLNVFHHIPDSEKFLNEANRVLKKGGILYMIEPAHTPVSKFIYQHFHHEPFNPKGDWFVRGGGPLSDSNQALPWIVFKRDVEIFKRKFPHLQINYTKLHTPFRYVLSGGLSKKQLVPDFLYPAILGMEKLGSPLHPFWALFQTIEIEKK